MKHNGATRTLLLLIDGVFPIFHLYTVYIEAAATTKRPLLSPGTAHNHRAATEHSPESADEIGCAARRGRRSGWRPSMMNGGGGASPLSTVKMSADHWCVYFTFLHLVSYLTINQQFGREAVKSHSDQRQVITENGQVF